MVGRNILINISISHMGDWDKIYNILSSKKDFPIEHNFQGKALTILDSDYPDRLRYATNPPFVLFYEGNLDLLKNSNIISVVGTREPSDTTFVGLNKLIDSSDTVINGGSFGTDMAVIDKVNHSIVVLPYGLDYDKTIVDKVVSKGGLVLTEYPLGVVKTTENCSARIRIIEALAAKTLVLEGKTHSSANLHVAYATNMGKDVFSVPLSLDRDDDFINNTLIQDGAICCTRKEQLSGE